MQESADGRLVNDFVSFKHPVVLLAPGVTAADVAEDIDRLSLLTEFFSEISVKIGPTLHWVYVSYGKRGARFLSRPWRVSRTDTTRAGVPGTWMPRTRSAGPALVDATSGQVIMTVSKKLRHADGSPAGVAGHGCPAHRGAADRRPVLSVDRRHAVVSGCAGRQIRKLDPTELLIVAQKDYQTQASSWEGALKPERLTAEDPERMTRLVNEIANGRSGYLEMPYQGASFDMGVCSPSRQSVFCRHRPPGGDRPAAGKNRQRRPDVHTPKSF